MYRSLHFWFHAAKLVGELCDEEVIWETTWSVLDLDVGILSITATVKGVSYGPINLIIEESST
jgi:hypothetical protein